MVFFEYVIGHVFIVCAALYIVIGLKIEPRKHSVIKVFMINLGYSAIVGAVDFLTGANYMFLRKPPGEWTLLRLLGPWPRYIFSVDAAIFLFVILYSQFWLKNKFSKPLSIFEIGKLIA